MFLSIRDNSDGTNNQDVNPDNGWVLLGHGALDIIDGNKTLL